MIDGIEMKDVEIVEDDDFWYRIEEQKYLWICEVCNSSGVFDLDDKDSMQFTFSAEVNFYGDINNKDLILMCPHCGIIYVLPELLCY